MSLFQKICLVMLALTLVSVAIGWVMNKWGLPIPPSADTDLEWWDSLWRPRKARVFKRGDKIILAGTDGTEEVVSVLIILPEFITLKRAPFKPIYFDPPI